MHSLEVSTEEVTFHYQPKGHLQSTFTITNRHDAHAYFKFKVTRPKYYLIKPDQGFCEAKSTVTISITLHQDGVEQAESDKFKMYYKFVGHSKQQPTKGWEKEELDVMHIRFTVVVNNLPEEFRRNIDKVKISDVKSISNSKFGSDDRSSNTTLQNIIYEREGKLANLRSQVSELRSHSGKLSKLGFPGKEYVIAGCVGIVLGLLSSLWI